MARRKKDEKSNVVMLHVRVPSRKMRREIVKQKVPCGFCGLELDHTDVVVVTEVGSTTMYVGHEGCARGLSVKPKEKK